jgi:Arc/MetJ-type ribon-helix-helix transcriptional regulator
VYLDRPDHARLDWLVDQIGSNKSDVLRRALVALEHEIGDPAQHPALRVIGLAASENPPAVRYDVAREHDRYLADLEDARTTPVKRRRRGA